MAQRATGFAKKPPQSRSSRVISPRSAANSPVALHPIALNLAPLLAPYKKKGRLSLRIERLPQFARLSAGRNRGDGSWSLASDELEDLTYLVPETVRETHTLGFRIISLDGDAGETLALLDYVVSPGSFEEGESEAECEEAEPEAKVAGVELGDLALLQRLRGELAETKAHLLIKEKDPEKAETDPELIKEKIDAKLAAARVVWKAELDEQLAAAAAEAAAALEKARREWEAEHAPRKGAKGDAELAKARNVWKAELEKRLAEAAAHAKAELAKARAQWEAERDADTTKQTRAETAKSESTKAKIESELAKARAAWNDELEARLAEARENAAAELAAARETWEKERNAQVARQAKTESAKGKIESELTAARAAWKVELEDRLAAAALEAAAVLARTKQAWEAEQARALKAAEDAAQAERAAERERLEKEAKDALALAEERRKEDADARAAAAASDFEERLESALAEAHAEAIAEKRRQEEAEIVPLREKVAELEAAIAERDEALTKAGSEGEEARRIWQRESAEALTKAEEAAKTAAVEWEARFAAAKAEWKEQSGKDQKAAEALLDEANAALKAAWDKSAADTDAARSKAEAEIAQARAKAEADIAAMRAEADADIASMRAKADEEIAAARARADSDIADARAKADNQTHTLRDEIASLNLAIAERDRVFERYKHDASATLAKTEAEWRSTLDARVEETEARFKRQYSGALADASSRAESAEAALALIRHKAARDQNDHGDNLEVNRLRDELAALQRTLAERERELHQLRGDLGDPDAPFVPDMAIALRTNQAWKQAEAAEQRRRAKSAGGRIAMLGGVGMVAAAVVAGVLFFTGDDAAGPSSAVSTSATSGVGETHRGAQNTATITKDSNLRGGASTASPVVGSVKRGMHVAIIGKENNWRQIRFAREGAGGVQEGWVHSSRLSEAPRAAQPPQAPAHVPPRRPRRR